MKKLVLLLILGFSINLFSQATYTSAAAGNWNASGTWTLTSGTDSDGNGWPDSNDDVIINHAITLAVTNNYCADFTMNAGGSVIMGGRTLIFYGDVSNAGTFSQNGKYIKYYGGTISSTSTISNSAQFTIYPTGGAVTISAGTVFSNLTAFTVSGAGSVTNNGSITATTSLTVPGTLINGATGTITTHKNISITGTFNTSTSGNTVVYQGNGWTSVYATTYHNLTINNGTGSTVGSKSLSGAITVNGNFTIASNVALNCANFNINSNGNWIHQGATASTNLTNLGTVTFGGTNPTISRRSIQEQLGAVIINCTGTFAPTDFAAGYTGNFQCTSLTLTSGTVDLDATDNYTLSVSGNVTVAGASLTVQNGVLNLNGTTAQTISGNTATFENITAANAAGVSTTSAQNLTGTLTVSSGTFTSNTADFTLVSDAASGETARIAALTSGSVAGTRWVVQRSILTTGNSTTDPYWGDYSSPVTSATLSDWDNEMYLSGVGGADGTACCPSFNSVMEWNDGSGDYSEVTSLINLTPGYGYSIWTATSSTSLTAFTFDTKGTPNSGSIPVSAPAADYYLLGNPYPSQVLWSNLARTNIGDYFWVLDESIQDYASWDGSSGTGTGKLNGSGGVINSSQGFLVESFGSGTLTFDESDKTTSTADYVKLAAPANMVKFHFSKGGKQVGTENMIHFIAGANNDRDQLDIPFKKSPFAKKYEVKTLTLNGDQLSKNTLDLDNESHEIPLVFIPADAGNYTVSFDGLELGGYNCIYLEDIGEGKFVNIAKEKSYTFSHNATGERKFVLHFNRLPDASQACMEKSGVFDQVKANAHVSKVFSTPSGIAVDFETSEPVKAKIQVFNSLGQLVVSEEQYYVNGRYLLEKPANSGVYFVNILADNKSESHKIFVE